VRQMPGIKNPYKTNDPQPLDAFDRTQQKFIAQFIPASDVDDQGRVNPYPLMRVEVADKKSKKVVARTDTVYTTASETRCRECHAKGKIAADDTVWRTPVSESELVNADGTPGPATGAGSFDPGVDPTKPWPPAIHNRFDDKHPENPAFTNLAPGANDPNSTAYIPRDANGLRTDRIAESRIGPDGKLQVRLKFHEAESDSWADQEKAALFNTLLMHDYMVFYGPTPATGMKWPASYSSQLADYYGDDIGKARSQPQYFCSGHHYSQLKIDNGVAGRSYPTNRSDYSRAFHAFHGKMQVYKQDVTAADSVDHLPHQKGDLIRDERGHPKMFGGRGWDSQHNDDVGVPLKQDTTGAFTVKSAYTWDALKNNWRPDLFPKEPNAELMLHFGEGVAMQENCTKCHTGATEKSYRDIHHASGLQCDNCHGDMLAVGNVYSNKQYDANLTGGGVFGGESVHFRRPWLDEPDCGSCHVGDGNSKEAGNGFFSAGVKKVAYDANDPAKASAFPDNARFAVMPVVEQRKEKVTVTVKDGSGNPVLGSDGKTALTKTDYQAFPISQALYRKSKDVHGSGPNGNLSCSACHGGSHSLWPNADPNANDNVTAKQLQGYDGNIAECSVCHIKDDFKNGMVATNGGTSNLGVGQGVRDGTVVNATSPRAYLAGPHGMHPVNDPSWWKEAELSAPNKSGTRKGGWHNDFAQKAGPDGEDQCAACHGSDHKGTRLSKALTDRSFVDENGKPVKVAANTPIGCDLCHALDKSFTASPKGQAKPHAPPSPMPIAATGSTGMGGMGH
ncbi:MAG: PKD domain-containing protein, partial [Methylococcaceae bacterium]